jgi:glycosyltransferase involved in cell wall biosynthesis
MYKDRIPPYLSCPQSFISHRLNYYQDSRPITSKRLEDRIFPPELPYELITQRQNVLENLSRQKEDVTVVTATYDRPDDIATAYNLLSQQTLTSWAWVVIDNGTEHQTADFIQMLNDPRVHLVKYLERTGCAYPSRNMGLDIVHRAKMFQTHPSQVAVIDSDDRLYDRESLHELTQIAKTGIGHGSTIALSHGYSATEIHEADKETVYVPNPRDLGSNFPQVNSLKEVFDKGLNILAGIFPRELLSILRYPEEFSFEDDGLNQKLLLQAKRLGMIWVADAVPTTIKIFHQESMSGKNNTLGDTTQKGSIGLHQVSGIRATIVSYLHDITDYYTQQNL